MPSPAHPRCDLVSRPGRVLGGRLWDHLRTRCGQAQLDGHPKARPPEFLSLPTLSEGRQVPSMQIDGRERAAYHAPRA